MTEIDNLEIAFKKKFFSSIKFTDDDDVVNVINAWSFDRESVWNFINEQCKLAAIDAMINENKYWINKITVPNDIKFTGRIKELDKIKKQLESQT